MEALEADPIAWSESIDDEYPRLVEMGVIDDNNGKGYTKKQLEKEGIFLEDMKAVPLGLYHTHHYDKGVNVDRLKTRAAVKGHSGNMTKGIHFSETFAATPREVLAIQQETQDFKTFDKTAKSDQDLNTTR